MKHVVSTTQPVDIDIGDEWFNPTINQLYKFLPSNGTNSIWITYGGQVVSSGGGAASPSPSSPAPWFI